MLCCVGWLDHCCICLVAYKICLVASIGLGDSRLGTFDIELWQHTTMATYNSDHGLFSPEVKSP